MLIDTHAHLDMEEYDNDFQDVLEEIKNAGVEKVIIPGVLADRFEKLISLIDDNDMLYGALGVHPSDAETFDSFAIAEIDKYISHPKIVAIGEVGLDYHWNSENKELQQSVFKTQIELALKYKKPLIVHNRDAHLDTMNILKAYDVSSKIPVIMHCFSGSVEFMQECVKNNIYISFSGVVTFKNAKIPKEVAKQVPLEYLLVETDSPFLTPHPYRGERNNPAYVKLIAEEIALLKGLSYEEIEAVTTFNAKKIFKL